MAAKGNAEHLNDALALLTPFAEDTDEVLKVLRQQSGATQRFVRDTGYVFDALSERKGQLRDLIRNSNRTWEAIASRDAQLADTFRVFPTFLREGRTTTQRLTKFANDTNPLITQLRPAARELSPTLIDLDALAPDLKGLFQDLDPLVQVSKRGLPATEQVLDNTRPILRRLDPWLRNFTPIVDYLGLYKREISAFIVNDAAATQGTERGFNEQQLPPLPAHGEPGEPGDDDRLAVPARARTARTRTPSRAGTTSSRPRATSRCSAASSAPPGPRRPRRRPNECLTANVAAQIEQFIFGGTENRDKAPPCDPQAPLGSIVGQSGQFPHLEPLPVCRLRRLRAKLDCCVIERALRRALVGAVTRRPLLVLGLTARAGAGRRRTRAAARAERGD